MPVLTSMGLKKIWIAEANSADTTLFPAYGSDWADLGDVYKDTCQMVDGDPDEVKHESETSARKITLYGETPTTVELSLMDPDMAKLQKYFGGTITGTAGARHWIRPKKLPYKEFAVLQQPEEGIVIGCPNCVIKPKFEITYSKTGIALVPLVITYQDQLHGIEIADGWDPTKANSTPALNPSA